MQNRRSGDLTGSTIQSRSRTAQLMDSIPSTSAPDSSHLDRRSVATAPVNAGVANSITDTDSRPTTPRDVSAVRAAHAVPPQVAGGAPTVRAAIPQPTPQFAAPSAVAGGVQPGLLGPPTATADQACDIPGPCRSGPDDTTTGPPLGANAVRRVPHSYQERFANAHPQSMDSAQDARAVVDGTTGSINRTLQKYASGAMPTLPPDPKNPLVYSQAVFNEQDEFVDNTGKYKLVIKGVLSSIALVLACKHV